MADHDPNEMVTFHATAADGAALELQMPRWAYDAIQRGQAVVWHSGGELELLVGDEREITRRYPDEDF